MKVLVIPDVHLKPWIFDEARDLFKEKVAEVAICLMDIADDWGQERNLSLYEETYDSAIRFAKQLKDSLWCYGNHDISYKIGALESGYSVWAEDIVRHKVSELENLLCNSGRLAYIHRIDNVLFLHGGLTDYFVKQNVKSKEYNDVDAVLSRINEMRAKDLWDDSSPIWTRPQGKALKMYKPRKLLQVVGHTPVRSIAREGNVISCDTFSTYPDGTPIGTQEFLIVDTERWEWQGSSTFRNGP